MELHYILESVLSITVLTLKIIKTFESNPSFISLFFFFLAFTKYNTIYKLVFGVVFVFVFELETENRYCKS